ncbi:hypothetical protein AAFC00_003966 [Neodothiora populina]|uniref:25S rRNA (Uridine(2843)-N(3))-methyltransferase n=1 Tax=Neodothiora populina TaxID=2781224 RepID=A0ABR3PI37_9PEZI
MGQYDRKAQSQRKHGPLTVSGASKAPVVPPTGRPGWKGPSYVKKRPSRNSSVPTPPATVTQAQLLPVELQQLALNIFYDTFPVAKDFESLKPTLQEVNDALACKDRDRAFGSEDYRDAYAVRWSPSRALTYANVLAWICNEKCREERWVECFSNNKDDWRDAEPRSNETARVVCFGGGAAEIMAFAALSRYQRPDESGVPSQESQEVANVDSSGTVKTPTRLHATSRPSSPVLDLHLVDTPDWTRVISDLQSYLETPPVLSKYASATARANNAAFLSSGAIRPRFTQLNMLDLSTDALRAIVASEPTLFTFFFSLQELSSTSVPKATALLRKITAAAPRDSLLLILESPGAHVEISTGNSESTADVLDESRSCPINWLNDRILLQKPLSKTEGEETTALWQKVLDEESRQHKLDVKLRYPALENMKFQLQLYKRI